MNHRRPKALLISACLAAFATPSSAADALERILAPLAHEPHQHVRFVEQSELAIATAPVISRGELRFDAPDRLEKHTLSPFDEDLLVDGERATIRRGTHTHATALDHLAGARPLLLALIATLNGDAQALRALFDVTTDSNPEGWLIRLTPRAASPQTPKLLELRGRDAVLRSVSLRRPNGDRTVLTLEPADAP